MQPHLFLAWEEMGDTARAGLGVAFEGDGEDVSSFEGEGDGDNAGKHQREGNLRC